MTSFIFLFFFFFFSSLDFLITARAQDRAPHGLAHANPMAFSPSAAQFFHPNEYSKDPCDESSCSTLPLAAQVRSARAYESKFSTSSKSGNHLGAGAITGVVLSVTFLLGMGAFYAFRTRRAKASRASSVRAPNSVQTDA